LVFLYSENILKTKLRDGPSW